MERRGCVVCGKEGTAEQMCGRIVVKFGVRCRDVEEEACLGPGELKFMFSCRVGCLSRWEVCAGV